MSSFFMPKRASQAVKVRKTDEPSKAKQIKISEGNIHNQTTRKSRQTKKLLGISSVKSITQVLSSMIP